MSTPCTEHGNEYPRAPLLDNDHIRRVELVAIQPSICLDCASDFLALICMWRASSKSSSNSGSISESRCNRDGYRYQSRSLAASTSWQRVEGFHFRFLTTASRLSDLNMGISIPRILGNPLTSNCIEATHSSKSAVRQSILSTFSANRIIRI